MGKWGCRGIPRGRQPFHHPLCMTADLKVHTHTHTTYSLSHTHQGPACHGLTVRRKTTKCKSWHIERGWFLCLCDSFLCNIITQISSCSSVMALRVWSVFLLLHCSFETRVCFWIICLLVFLNKEMMTLNTGFDIHAYVYANDLQFIKDLGWWYTRQFFGQLWWATVSNKLPQYCCFNPIKTRRC